MNSKNRFLLSFSISIIIFIGTFFILGLEQAFYYSLGFFLVYFFVYPWLLKIKNDSENSSSR
ncbi:hypothetical protein AN965_13535 [Alkalicoccobacillus plakortidis]|uniref:Uncharacterized protein n=1 Tax=Alkalicoccobacillus plakortidis TaxID=444060 RepID=A0A9D5DM15_9BACI|nr:hypothetical protein AN965_13535 [Alkalicoccobacillus plakortidis]